MIVALTVVLAIVVAVAAGVGVLVQRLMTVTRGLSLAVATATDRLGGLADELTDELAVTSAESERLRISVEDRGVTTRN